MRSSKKSTPPSRPVRIVFFLGAHFGVFFLRKIRRLKNLDVRVVTYSQDSDAYYGYESVVAYCRKNGIPFLDTTKGADQVQAYCSAHHPDLIVCGYYARLLPPAILGLAKDGAFNIHPGKLPWYRGPFPTAWAILYGEKKVGITIHQMDSHADTGPILNQKTYPIRPQETGHELYRRVMELSAGQFSAFLPKLIRRQYRPQNQASLGAGNYYGKIPAYYQIDWQERADKIRDLVRIHAKPYFPAYTFVKNKMVLINRCRVAENPKIALIGAGKILGAAKGTGFFVTCGEGVLEVTDYEVCPLAKGERKEWFLPVGTRFT